MKKYSKRKAGEQLGYKTPSFVRAKNFGKVSQAKYNPGIFKTQHKG